MSFVMAAPEALVTAASDLTTVGSTLTKASNAAAARTTNVLAGAADEVSTQIAALFSEHGLRYQQLTTHAAAFHQQFVQALTEGAKTYAAAEASAAQTLSSSIAGANRALSTAFSTAANHIGSVTPGSGGLTSLLGSGPAAAKAATGGLGALTSGSAALSPAATTHAAAYYPYGYYGYGYYGYPLLDLVYSFIGVLLYEPLYLPFWLIDTALYLPYYLLGWL
jgi:hypothetical protein